MSTSPTKPLSLRTPRVRALCLVGLLFAILIPSAMAQSNPNSGVVLFWENGFPAADIAQPPESQVHDLFPGLETVGAAGLREKLATAQLLVLPFGSSFPESQWLDIRRFLDRGGNLVVLGGLPFIRPAYRDAHGSWQLRPATQAFARELRIFRYDPTSGAGLAFAVNPEIAGPTVPEFSWQNAWSLTLRLSGKAVDEGEGSAGSLDAFFRPLAWGVRNTRRISVPVVELDHIRNAFVGGRWELFTCDPGPDFWTSPYARTLIRTLVERALNGASDFRVQPQFAVFAEGEPWRFELTWNHPKANPQPLRVEIEIEAADTKPRTERLDFTPSVFPFQVGFELKPSAKARGRQHITARLYEGGHIAAIYQTGFWMRDDKLLRSGPVVTIDKDFFLLDGKPQPIVGTTYMASDVQRQYFDYPNPYVWDRDMEQISAAGLNMLRTGWWTGWDRLTDNGIPTEKTLRALEAFLLTARKHHLPVQFNIFAFTPHAKPDENPYLDPAATSAQQSLVASLLNRFKDVPYLGWDIINEPSFSNPRRTWITRPNGDEFELRAWNDWLKRKYKSHAEAAAAWRATPVPDDALIPLPADGDFLGRDLLAGASPARAYDYHLFAQESFAAWAAKIRETVRATGSRQLVTVGQDEGGVTNRPLTAFFASSVDFTTNHTWWLNDALLWDSLAAKQPGLPLLIQETGIQHQSNPDGTSRLSDEQEAMLFERKVAIALATSSGAIQWLWNTNAYMMPPMELTIGALRPDGTEKPEADVLRRYAKFAHDSAGFFRDPVSPDIVIVTSQALQFSPYGEQALTAQQRAVRALHYDLHLSASVLAENQVDKLGSPKLVILPSPQALTQNAWDRLLAYVRAGGYVLVTGPVERDEHWQPAKRITTFSPSARTEPLLSHYSELQFGAERVLMTFNEAAHQQLERLSLPQFVMDLPVGSGHIYTTADPVELAEGPQATVRLYRQIATALQLKPAFDLKSETQPVLIRATEMRDAMLYLFVSESAHDETIQLTDHLTGAILSLNLPSQRARLALIRKSDHSILWSPE